MNDGNDQSAQAREFRENFMKSLLLDVIAAMQRQSDSDTQSTRRELVRTLFAAIEGLVWTYRQHVVQAAGELEILTPEEDLAFSEKSVVVTDQGKIVEQTKFMPLLAVIRLTTRLALRINATIEARFDGADWDKFRKALKVRHRVTHPKSNADLLLDTEDVLICLAAFDWLFQLCLSAMMSVTVALREYLKEFRDLIKALERGDPDTIAEYQAVAASLLK